MKYEICILKDLIKTPINGEWGTEVLGDKSENPTKVIRTTNFTNNGTIDYSNIILRNISCEKLSKKQLQYGDIIVEKSGGTDKNPVGRVVYFDRYDDFVCNNFTTIFRVKEDFKIESKYLLYYLLQNYNSRGTFKYFNKTTGIQNLKVKSFIEKIKIPVPPIETQKQIVRVLDEAQSLIDNRKKQIEMLDDLIESVFYEMFGDPVKNEKGWDIKILNDISDVRDGTHDSPKYVKEGFPLITSKNLKDGYINYETVNLISKKDYDAINKRSKVEKGDILMPMIGTIGNPIIVTDEVEFAIKNVALIKFNKSREILNVFIRELFNSSYFEKAIKNNKRGGTQKFISLGNIRNLDIPVPPLSLQNEFADKVHEIETQKEKLSESLKLMEDNYNSLMQKAFKGELF